ncbi:hypothetical protein AUJ17_05315 [Candidatus Micrarchaeota archaeon CG1_02_47_40]|nr:MAG: hypothetical protein AUJ17_05315 [Candidatus Micrarchaeota archaeon CG1_02_47_40]
MDKLSLFAVLFALAGIVMIFALSSGIGGNEIIDSATGGNTLAGSGADGTGSNSGGGGCGGVSGGGCGSAVGVGGCGCGGGIGGNTNAGGSADTGSKADAGGAGSGAAGSGTGTGAGSGSVQDVYIKALGSGRYDKGEVRVKAGVPVRFHFSAEQNSGCGKLVVMEEFGVRLVSYNGEETVAQFTPTQKGIYEYHCGMHMFVGRMIVE